MMCCTPNILAGRDVSGRYNCGRCGFWQQRQNRYTYTSVPTPIFYCCISKIPCSILCLGICFVVHIDRSPFFPGKRQGGAIGPVRVRVHVYSLSKRVSPLIIQEPVRTLGCATGLYYRPLPGQRVGHSALCLYSTTAWLVPLIVPWLTCDSRTYMNLS